MVTKHLGFSIDIACGGIDNLVRHHDYTLAVAEAASDKQFASYWLHGGHLYVDGKKMSKSLGNVLHPEDLTSKGYQNHHVRFFLIYGPYGEKRNFTWDALKETSQRLDEFRRMVKVIQSVTPLTAESSTPQLQKIFEAYMNQNLNVQAAFDELYKAVTQLAELGEKKKLSQQAQKTALAELHAINSVLQVFF